MRKLRKILYLSGTKMHSVTTLEESYADGTFWSLSLLSLLTFADKQSKTTGGGLVGSDCSRAALSEAWNTCNVF